MNIATRLDGHATIGYEPWPSLNALCRWTSARASEAETRPTGLAPEMDRLRQAGLLVACLPPTLGGGGLGQGEKTAVATFDILRWIGRASLPVARLFEGHMNAVKLISLYGSPGQKQSLLAGQVSGGALLGVWAADDVKPVTYDERADGTVILAGKKAFASGLGCVTTAIITARAGMPEGGISRLLAVDVTATCRQDISVWRANGMKATLSGSFDFEGFHVPQGSFFGEPGDYEKEPHFDGGIWRYCAAHIGGAESVIDASLDVVVSRRQLDDPLQQSRFGQAIARCRAATALVREWACRVEGATEGGRDTPQHAVAGVVLARSIVYDMCVDVLQLCERAVGTAAYMQGSTLDRLRRDLSLYIRQAAPDAKFAKATWSLLRESNRDHSLW